MPLINYWKKLLRSVPQKRCFISYYFLFLFFVYFCKIHKKTVCQSLFLIKLLARAALLKRDPTQVFSCEFCEFIKFFAKHLGVSVSEVKSVTSLYWAFVFEPLLFHGCNIENIERDWQLLFYFFILIIISIY